MTHKWSGMLDHGFEPRQNLYKMDETMDVRQIRKHTVKATKWVIVTPKKHMFYIV